MRLTRTYKTTKGESAINCGFDQGDHTIKTVEAPYIDLDSFCGSFLATHETADSYRIDGNFIVFTSSSALRKIELIKEMDQMAKDHFGSCELIKEEIEDEL